MMSSMSLAFIIIFISLISIECLNLPRNLFTNKISFMKNRTTELFANEVSNDLLTTTTVDTMNTLDYTWTHLEDTGNMLLNYSKWSLFSRALAAGMFVGFGGILSASVGFDIGNSYPWQPGNGLQRLASGAIGFPLSILLISMTGCGAWTGDMLLISRAFFGSRKETSVLDVMRCASITWLGSLVGTILMALLATGAALPACGPCLAIAKHKLTFTFLQTFLRAIGGGCLICLAIFMSRLNRDMAGKAIGIWFPISAYVICDMEHVLASMFFLTCAKLNDPTAFKTIDIIKLLLPSTLGNLVGGALMIGLGLFSIPKRTRRNKQAE